MKSKIGFIHIKRFWDNVEKTKKCWLWTGGIKSTGRGNLWVNGKTEQAHRVSWMINRGPIPEGQCVLHR